MDDMIDTAGTLCQAANLLKARGARSVMAYCTHPVLSSDAVTRIEDTVIDTLIVTDSIACGPQVGRCAKIRQISLGPLIAETIRRLIRKESISSMFVA